jgi:hypothetical protein
MDTSNLVLSIASIVNFGALLLMLRAVIKNRNVLRGYSVTGSFLTFVSIVGFEVAYYLLGNVVGFALGWQPLRSGSWLFFTALGNGLKGQKKRSK